MKRRSLRTQPAIKTKMTLSTRYLVAGSAFLIVCIVGVIMYLNLAGNQDAQAGTKEPVGNAPRPESTQMLTVSLQTTNGEVLMQQQAVASDKAVDVDLPKELPAGLYLMKVKGGKKAESQAISIKLASTK